MWAMRLVPGPWLSSTRSCPQVSTWRKVPVSLFFQPGSTRVTDCEVAASRALFSVAPDDPPSLVCAALEALALGDGSRLERIFTDDVQFRGPHVSVRSRAELLHTVVSPDSALGEIEITLSNVVRGNSMVAAEWLAEAMLISPVLFGDNVLLEPTNARLHLRGSSFAVFSGGRIQAFRCYFDDSEMFDSVPGVMQPLRFTARWPGSPR
jgi:hypothetical protein